MVLDTILLLPFEEGTIVVEILVVMGCSLALVFLFSFLEVVWLTVYDDDVVSHEHRVGGTTGATTTIKALIRERMVVECSILFLVFIILSVSSFALGRLTEGKDGVVPLLLLGYTIILFFVGEVAAKNLGYRWALPAALISAMPLHAMLRIFFPVTWLLRSIQWMTGGKDLRLFGQKDVIAAAQAAEQSGGVHAEEADAIERFLDLGDRTVDELAIPLGKCAKIGLKPTRAELREMAIRRHKIVVCASDGLTIVGMVTSKDLISVVCGKPEEVVDLTAKLRPVVDLPHNMAIPDAIRLLRKKPLGVVTDKGRAVGIIITNDLLDVIIGSKSE